jgi:hypothetical protein
MTTRSGPRDAAAALAAAKARLYERVARTSWKFSQSLHELVRLLEGVDSRATKHSVHEYVEARLLRLKKEGRLGPSQCLQLCIIITFGVRKIPVDLRMRALKMLARRAPESDVHFICATFPGLAEQIAKAIGGD